jgi:hypothetical protein
MNETDAKKKKGIGPSGILLLGTLIPVLFCFCMAVPATPIILQPGIRDREAGLLRYLLLVGNRRYFVVEDLATALTDQIEVLFKVTFVAVLHGIKLQRFNDTQAGELVQCRIGGG